MKNKYNSEPIKNEYLNILYINSIIYSKFTYTL